MKKILITLLIMLTMPYASAAPNDKTTIGIFMEAPVTFVNNETVRKMVPEKTKNLFSETVFNVLPFETTSMELRTYKEALGKALEELTLDTSLMIKPVKPLETIE